MKKPKKEPKGFISWANAGPRKIHQGVHVAPDRVKVYYNLNLECLSVIDAETNLLYCHAHRVELKDASFRVQEAGRQRVLREKRKNVHAYIVGNFHDIGERHAACVCKGYDNCEDCCPESMPIFEGATYNPYKYKTFVNDVSKSPIHKSEHVVVRDRTAIGYMFNIFYIPEPMPKPWFGGRKRAKLLELT